LTNNDKSTLSAPQTRLETLYWTEVARQASLRGKPAPSKLDLEVAKAVLEAGQHALQDMKDGRRVHRTLASATGSGKSSMCACLASALLKSDPDSSVLFICPDIRMAEATYFELAKLIDPADIAIWTSGHDFKTELSKIRSDFDGFEPKAPRYWKGDLVSRRLAIVTHKFYIQRGGVDGLTYQAGGRGLHTPRLHLIDERLNEVKLTDLEQADVTAARDTIFKLKGHDPAVATAIHSLHEYLNGVWENDKAGPAGSFKALSNDTLEWFLSPDAALAERKTPLPVIANAISFGRSLVTGRAFLARYPEAWARGGRFLAYALDLPIAAGSILMDGTSDIDGVNQIATWREPIKPPHVSYDRLSIKHIRFPVVDPDGYRKNVKAITDNADLATRYAAWIEEQIIAETKPGEDVLCVTHKQMVEQGRIPRSDFTTPWLVGPVGEERKVAVTTFGRSVGSNAYKRATTVVLCGEYWKPHRVTMGTVHGLRDEPANDDELSAMANVKTRHGLFTTIKNGHLLLWSKQLAMRGSARNFDESGVCGAMKLVAIGDFDLWFNSHWKMFPGATFEYDPLLVRDGRPAIAMASYITSHPQGGFDSKDVCEACGIKPANFAKYLKSAAVQASLERTGLTTTKTRPVQFIQWEPSAIAAE
jgi:Type III restriction enzyme, res subunit